MKLGSINKRVQNRLPARPLEPSRARTSPACRIVDISGTGCLLESTVPLGRVGSIVPFELPLPTQADYPIVRAKVVWEKVGPDRGGPPSFRYGLSFRQMDGASHIALNLYLEYLKHDQHVKQLDEAWRNSRERKPPPAPSVLGEGPDDAVPSISEKPVRGRKNKGNAFVR